MNTNTSRSTRMSTSTSTNMSTRTRSSSMRLGRRFLDLLINLCESHDLFPPLFPHPSSAWARGGGGDVSGDILNRVLKMALQLCCHMRDTQSKWDRTIFGAFFCM